MRIRAVVVAAVVILAAGLVAAPSVVATGDADFANKAARSLDERRERIAAAHERVLELKAELRAAVVELRRERAAAFREFGHEALGERPQKRKGSGRPGVRPGERPGVRPGERPGKGPRLWGGTPGEFRVPRLW